MAIICGIDYGDLIFSKRHELDKQAYAKYYNDYFEGAKTFNSWYGTKSHIKYISTPAKTFSLDKSKCCPNPRVKIAPLKYPVNCNVLYLLSIQFVIALKPISY